MPVFWACCWCGCGLVCIGAGQYFAAARFWAWSCCQPIIGFGCSIVAAYGHGYCAVCCTAEPRAALGCCRLATGSASCAWWPSCCLRFWPYPLKLLSKAHWAVSGRVCCPCKVLQDWELTKQAFGWLLASKIPLWPPNYPLLPCWSMFFVWRCPWARPCWHGQFCAGHKPPLRMATIAE